MAYLGLIGFIICQQSTKEYMSKVTIEDELVLYSIAMRNGYRILVSTSVRSASRSHIFI